MVEHFQLTDIFHTFHVSQPYNNDSVGCWRILAGLEPRADHYLAELLYLEHQSLTRMTAAYVGLW